MTPKAPSSLRLAFSRAADGGFIRSLFDPATKNSFDPNSYVAKRDDAVLDCTISIGGVAMLQDDAGEIHTMSAAYHLYSSTAAACGDSPDYAEIGTTLARLPGYNSARLVIAALVLREWWARKPHNHFVAEIDAGNGPSIKTFNGALGWPKLTDPAKQQELQVLCDTALAPEERGKPVDWYYCDESLIARQAAVVLSFMDQGGLHNKHTGGTIAVDFSELAASGLTRQRLDVMAKGTTDKARILTLAP